MVLQLVLGYKNANLYLIDSTSCHRDLAVNYLEVGCALMAYRPLCRIHVVFSSLLYDVLRQQ